MNKKAQYTDWTITAITIIAAIVFIAVLIFTVMKGHYNMKEACIEQGLRFSDAEGKCYERVGGRVVLYDLVLKSGWSDKYYVNKYPSVED